MAVPKQRQIPRVGLIINPIAGIGGRAGLKGSDGLAIQEQAAALGGKSKASDRTRQTLDRLTALPELQVITFPAEMGEQAVLTAGLRPTVIGAIKPGRTTAKDTRRAAEMMVREGVQLILFAGGDGTARDLCQAIGDRCPVLGIPAGVKIYSAVFAVSPSAAGDLAGLFLRGKISRLREAEVMDVDEEALRQGRISARLYGYLNMPFKTGLVQSLKSTGGAGEGQVIAAIAQETLEIMSDDMMTILGPGTTTQAILAAMGLEKTLIGVDVVAGGRLLAADVNEAMLLGLLVEKPARIVVTPIGGLGFVFGRGNQQISWRVIKRVIQQGGRQNIIVVSAPEKLHSLGGRPLLVDTGCRQLDRDLAGYLQVVTGYKERIVYRFAAP